jgi:hypothetical protein
VVDEQWWVLLITSLAGASVLALAKLAMLICALRGSEPAERPAILKELAGVFRAMGTSLPKWRRRT